MVYRQGRSLSRFHPGDLLSDDAVYFVRAAEANGGARAGSQYEALLQSACKRAAGDRLTCTTCHDAHGEPAPEQRVAFYRARCLSCHTSPALAVAHHPEQPDCASCHMPQRGTADISHEQVTDHDIERTPAHTGNRGTEEATLVAVGGFAAGDRELGLAYAQLAGRGQAKAAERALALLGRAEQREDADGTSAADSPLHANLGFLEQAAGKPLLARQEYMIALTADPYEAVALGNLAVLSAQAGDPLRAQHLRDRLVTADPTLPGAGLNLIRVECALGEAEAAQTVAHALLPFSPDNSELRGILEAGVCRSELKGSLKTKDNGASPFSRTNRADSTAAN